MIKKALSLSYMFLMSCSVATGEPPLSTTAIPHRTTFAITGSTICAPDNIFVLIHLNTRIAAIKFINSRQGKETATGAADYVAFYRVRGSGKPSISSWERETGHVSVDGWSGFHPFVSQRGNFKVSIDGINVTYSATTCVEMIAGYEYAATPWSEIEDVNHNEPRLQWLRYEPQSERLIEFLSKDALKITSGR